MTGDLHPYPAYKDSGVPWLDAVPVHWSLLPNRALMRRRKVLVGQRHAEYRLLSLTKEGIIVRDVESGKGKFSADMGTSQEVRNGDLVFCLFDVPETPRTVGLAHHAGMITGAYTVFECSDPALSAFLELFYRAMDDRKLLSPLYSGLRNTIPPTRFLGTKTPVPPPDEQTAIVRYLDHADRRIRHTIRAKQRLIALLNEQKQAIIQQAVTRGLDPNVRLKPSGVAWLGDVPEHWEVKRLKWVTRLQRGYDLPADRRIPGPFPVISSGGVIDSHCEARSQGPGVVLGRYGSTDAVFFVEKDFWPHNTALFVTDFQGNRPHWCYYLLRTISKADHASKSAVPGVDRKDLFEIMVTVPPVFEQDDVVAGIEKSSVHLGAAVDRTQRQITLLREYRTRLIADVVTGKLDVRAAAAALPDEVEVAEALDEEEATADDPESLDETESDAATDEQ